MGTTDLAEAKRLLKIRQGRIAEGHTPVKRIDRITYDEAANDLRLQYEATKTRNVEEAAFRFKNLDRFFRGTRLTRVAQQVPAYTIKRRSEGAADKTLNNEFEVLIKMLRLAYENNKLMRLPVIHKLKVNNVRQGFFEEEQFNEVCGLLRPDYQVAALNATTYGWRMQSEVLMLAWPMVDFAAGTLRPGPGMTKNDDGRIIYLTPDVSRMLHQQQVRVKLLERQSGLIIPWVFPHLEGRFRGQRIRDFKKAWKTACRKAGCLGMLRHDFRRTAVRNMERAGVSRSVAMKVNGHRSESVYRCYAIVSDADLRKASRKITGIVSGIVDTQSAD